MSSNHLDSTLATHEVSRTTAGSFCPLSIGQKKAGLLIFSLLYVPLFAGAFFGFGPMQIMLEESGAFSSLCTNNTASSNGTEMANDVVCAEQTARLLTVPFIGQTMILSSPFLGVAVDRYGPIALMAFVALCGCLGVSILLASVSFSIDEMLFPAFICIGLMATGSSTMTVKTGMVFSGDVQESNSTAEDRDGNGPRNQSRGISVLNVLFDAGSITYLGLWVITELGASISFMIGMYLVLAVFCFGGATLFWFALGKEMIPGESGDAPEGDTRVNTQVASGERGIEHQIVSTTIIGDSVDAVDSDTRMRLNGVDTASATIPGESDDAVESDTRTNIEVASSERVDTASALHTKNVPETKSTDEDVSPVVVEKTLPVAGSCHNELASNDHVLTCERSTREQLTSLPFWMLLTFFAINIARNQFVLTTTRDYLEYIADNDESAKDYLAIFTVLMPASVLGFPLTDLVIDRLGFHAGFQTVCLLSLTHGLIQVFCDKLNGVQIFGFVVFSFYRCFLFAIVFSYLPTSLSPRVVGKAIGAMHFTGGIFSLINIPLSNVTVKRLDGNFFIPNLIYTLLVVPCSMAAWMIGKSIQHESEVKLQRKAITKF